MAGECASPESQPESVQTRRCGHWGSTSTKATAASNPLLILGNYLIWAEISSSTRYMVTLSTTFRPAQGPNPPDGRRRLARRRSLAACFAIGAGEWSSVRRGERPVGGSIPAHAGEPGSARAASPSSRVYPRACGGNHPGMLQERSSSGSIPAHAEGTSRERSPNCCWRGLSPRMRGNRRLAFDKEHLVGSIPAHAGEPRSGRHDTTAGQVYPRACGGNRPRAHPECGYRGSIPAHAGGTSL